MGVQPFELGPFTGGVNLVDPPTRLKSDELSNCRNFRIGVRGDFYKRPGHGGYGSSPAKVNGDALVNLALRYYKSDGSKLLIAAAGGKLRKGDDITGAWTDISINGTGASMSASNLCDWMVYKDRLYVTDGVQPQRYDGANDINAGHFLPAAPTLAQTTGGVLTLLNTYQYFVTSVMGNLGEGPKNPAGVASITLTGSNNRVNLTAMVDAPAKYGETAKRIYRTKGNGSIFYFLAEIAEGITIYNDLSIADSALSVEYIAVSAPPAAARFVIMGHDERAYWFGMTGVDASLVKVSEVGFPDRVRDLDFFSVANNDGDILTGGGLVPGGILFLKKNSTWLLRAFGFGLINISPREKKGGGIGTTSPFSVVTTPVGLIFLSQRGEIYKFDGTNLEEIGRKISSEFKGMTQSSMGMVIACYHDYRYIISYDYRGTKGYNWKTLEYDTIADKWDGPFENGDFYNPSYYSVWDSVLDKGELYWGEGKAVNGSFVYGRTEFTQLDRGNKFISIATTGAIPLANLAEVKSTKAFVHGEISSDATLTFTHIDEAGVRAPVSLNVPIPATGAILDDAATCTFDNIILGGTSSSVLEGSLGSARSRVPIYEISDGGTATTVKMNIIQVLADGLPLK